MKFSELKELGHADAVLQQIRSHTETLRAQLVSSADRAEHYLLWTNGGAIVALLSFMAASERIRGLAAAWSALKFFAAGVFFCGVLVSLNYHFRVISFKRWNEDSRKFVQNLIDDTELDANSWRLARSLWGQLPVACGYIAFACFIAGAIIALSHLVPR